MSAGIWGDPHMLWLRSVYFDTEFSNLLAPELISVGLVDEDETQSCYVEIDPLPRRRTLFVDEVVVPLLSGGAARVAPRVASVAVREFLEGFATPVRLLCDYAGDLELLGKLMALSGPRLPACVADAAILTLGQRQEMIREEAFESELTRHHALHDAIALCRAHRGLGP